MAAPKAPVIGGSSRNIFMLLVVMVVSLGPLKRLMETYWAVENSSGLQLQDIVANGIREYYPLF